MGFILFWRASPPEIDPNEAAYQTYQGLPAFMHPNPNDTAIYIIWQG
ncbi:MAG: hypothetical protein U1F28_01150 [Acinetobacter sp.]